MTDPVSGLLVLETAYTTVEQAHGFRVPGYLIVQPKGECTRLGDLGQAEVADLMSCIARAEALVHELIQPARVYVLKFGEENPQIHFHIVPRTTQIEVAYLSDVPDDRPYSGARIVDWIWSRHASLGHTNEQIRSFVMAARQLVGA